MFRLVSTWVLPASPDRVWGEIADVERWPRWWPGIAESTVVRAGGVDGLGQRTSLVVRSPLGYRLRFGVEITQAEAPGFARARVVGGLTGEGSWTVTPTPGGCEATIRWFVAPSHGVLRSISGPAARPLTWAHAWVMQKGERALVELLADR